MGGAISVITSDINMNRLEKERVMPLKPKFYKRYVDGTITKIKKNTDIDKLIRSTNSHHPNIKLTVETNPTIFLDRVFSKNFDGSVTTNVFRKLGKLPTFWKSQMSKRYKRNNIQGDLHRAFKIASDFDAEVHTNTWKYLEVGHPISFTESVINDFKNSKEEKRLIITEWLFDKCWDVKRFIDKIERFTNGKSKFIVLWSTRNIKSLFPLKDRVKQLSCVIYERVVDGI